MAECERRAATSSRATKGGKGPFISIYITGGYLAIAAAAKQVLANNIGKLKIHM